MKKQLKVEIYRKYLKYRVKLVGKNNEPVLVSQTYFSKGNADRAAELVRGAEIV